MSSLQFCNFFSEIDNDLSVSEQLGRHRCNEAATVQYQECPCTILLGHNSTSTLVIVPPPHTDLACHHDSVWYQSQEGGLVYMIIFKCPETR
jgi:hypothetical protein